MRFALLPSRCFKCENRLHLIHDECLFPTCCNPISIYSIRPVPRSVQYPFQPSLAPQPPPSTPSPPLQLLSSPRTTTPLQRVCTPSIPPPSLTRQRPLLTCTARFTWNLTFPTAKSENKAANLKKEYNPGTFRFPFPHHHQRREEPHFSSFFLSSSLFFPLCLSPSSSLTVKR